MREDLSVKINGLILKMSFNIKSKENNEVLFLK